ncbi:YusU family protein [Bacillus spongiae]|uniref:YusU family protein n=1 Tax=Bacillus spongiae TaxID=2683610 RepID=A0ABU8HFH3_9BACI
MFYQQVDGLVEKYTELLLGEANEDLKEKVEKWILYTYISKSMPPLVKHWNTLYPEGKAEMKKLILEIKQLNEQHREATNRKDK